jgi:hypothetical protein
MVLEILSNYLYKIEGAPYHTDQKHQTIDFALLLVEFIGHQVTRMENEPLQ